MDFQFLNYITCITSVKSFNRDIYLNTIWYRYYLLCYKGHKPVMAAMWKNVTSILNKGIPFLKQTQGFNYTGEFLCFYGIQMKWSILPFKIKCALLNGRGNSSCVYWAIIWSSVVMKALLGRDSSFSLSEAGAGLTSDKMTYLDWCM